MDPMHIESNVAKNLLQTILGMEGKDTRAIRANCQAFGVHREAWIDPTKADLPDAPWVLGPNGRRIFMERLCRLRFPRFYGAGFAYSFSTDWPRGLKSHDYHCLMRHGFPVAIRGLLTPEVRNAIYGLCSVFR